MRILIDATPAITHMLIMNPDAAKSLMNLFNTHPHAGQRICHFLEQKTGA
jgi:hypothetical protein